MRKSHSNIDTMSHSNIQYSNMNTEPHSNTESHCYIGVSYVTLMNTEPPHHHHHPFFKVHVQNQINRGFNCEYVTVFIDGWPYVFVVATRLIQIGEPLRADYGGVFWCTRGNRDSLSSLVKF